MQKENIENALAQITRKMLLFKEILKFAAVSKAGQILMTHKIKNLAPKLKFAENRQGTQGNLEYLRSFKLFVGTYITFLKGYDAGYQMNSKKFKN